MEPPRLIKAVKETAKKHLMFKTGDSVLAGVSGGTDSVALVHILLKISSEFNLRLGIAHLDHGLRAAESNRDAEFVASFAHKYHLPFYTEKVDVREFSQRHKLSIEEAGRILRYRFLSSVARKNGFDKIALGHQKNDMVETVLMNILRGSGPLGLSGIPPTRGMFIRPLIYICRSDIESYIRSENIEHITDSSNINPLFLRNRIRHHLIPLLASEYNSEIVDTLSRTAEIIRGEEIWIDSVIDPLFTLTRLPGGDENITLSIPELRKMPLAAARRIIRKSVLEIKGDLNGIGFKHMDAVFELINTGSDNSQLDFPGPVRIKFEKDRLVFFRRKTAGRINRIKGRNGRKHSRFEYIINGPQTIYIKEIDQSIELTEQTSPRLFSVNENNFYDFDPRNAYMDMAAISYPLILRSFCSGDRFSPLGISGFQKLKKFFINNKVPFSERQSIPILECSGKIIWVAGYRIANHVKVNASTQKVLKAILLKGSI